MNTLMLLFILHSSNFGLPPNVLSSLCFVESSHNIEAIHYDDGGSNSVGVCQIKLTTAQQLGFQGTEEELMDPNNNIFYAAKYLQHQYKRYNYNIEKAVIAYNQGSAGNLKQTTYSKKVLAKCKETELNERATGSQARSRKARYESTFICSSN